ncbi:hypothetical protein NEPAR04_0132 [Nematocida parisii]|nr:hypothetical protein NEPAR03_0126 [Nematocida parisii]KAI5125690.1 hypothetical protein NEPAR08_0128 [Nematocida parisii]KAI5140187.1 hypothetical protein NEPAR04_0132 [Nematocida parisii]
MNSVMKVVLGISVIGAVAMAGTLLSKRYFLEEKSMVQCSEGLDFQKLNLANDSNKDKENAKASESAIVDAMELIPNISLGHNPSN